MAARVEFGDSSVIVGTGKLAKFDSPFGGVITVFPHPSGTWVGAEVSALTVQGKASVKAEGANLHKSGAYAQIIGEGGLPVLTVKHV